MYYRVLADLVAVIHLSFVFFVVGGGFLVLKWRKCAYVHVPAALWGVLVELMGWPCPLTPLENRFRERAGADVYATGFIEHYILPVLYPGELTRLLQITLGVALLALNIAIYSWLAVRFARRKIAKQPGR